MLWITVFLLVNVQGPGYLNLSTKPIAEMYNVLFKPNCINSGLYIMRQI